MRTLSVLVLLLAALPAVAQKQFGFDNRKPSGQPYRSPEETVKGFTVPPEFEVKLFAGEPDLVNPIAFTIDEKGRVWVVECFEYPSRTPKGKAPRDRIVILEDTDGDGACDKRTVFAEGKDFPVPDERKKAGLAAFDLASGIEVGHGGVFVGAPPYLWFIENKDDKPGKFETLLSGFGSQDTHEMLNTFQWGPDGWLYGLHGVFTQSNVQGEPESSATGDDDGVKMNGAVWRYHPKTKKFEIFAEGTSNPWGMDWRNTDGQFILACCVIPHLYHIVPGGIYKRQAGASYNPYAYGQINEICDHTFHKESGWAHAGLISLDVPHMPERFRNSVIFGSIHGCSIKQNILKPNGSTYIASRGDDFLQSADKNVRPINLRWGPNGDIYMIDWHDQNPCHQALPDSWDYERGRVYRIQLKGRERKKAEDIGRSKLARLVEACHTGTPYEQRTAWRLLGEQNRSNEQAIEYDHLLLHWAEKRVQTFAYQMPWLLDRQPLDPQRAASVLGGMASQNIKWKAEFMDWHVAGIVMTIRHVNHNVESKRIRDLMTSIAGQKWPPQVRRELASAAVIIADRYDARSLVHALMQRKEDATDPVIPHLIWVAYEKTLASGGREPPASRRRRQGAHAPRSPVDEELSWLRDHAADNPLVAGYVVPRVMRRLVATGEPEHLARCVRFAADLTDASAKRSALAGLAEALKDQTVPPPPAWAAARTVFAKSDDAEVRKLADQLAVAFRDPEAVKRAMAVLRNTGSPVADRTEAVRQLAALLPADSEKLFVGLIRDDSPLDVKVAAARGLAGFRGKEVAAEVLAQWKDYPPALRAELVNTLAGRKEWASALLAALADNRVDRADVTDNVVIRIQGFQDKTLDALIEKTWGRSRPTPDELLKLIDKTRGELAAEPGSFARGKLVFEQQCAKCHKFDGRGNEVGPPLDGAARDIEYLLGNVLDPNRVIGAPYFQRIVNTVDGRVEQGLLHAEDDRSITLKVENAVLKRIPKDDLEGPVKVVEKSLMPEGFANAMTPQNFRDLVRYVMAHPFITTVTVNGKPVTAGVIGTIPLDPQAGDETVVEAEFTASEPVPTKLLVGTAEPFTVYLDGKLIGKGTGVGRRVDPDREAFDVTLTKGDHTLRIVTAAKVAGTPLYVRFLDPNRTLTYPE